MSRGPDPKIGKIDILRVFLRSPEPAFMSTEIAEELDVTSEGARHQMNKLVDEGLLKKKKPSRNAVIYWVTDEGRQFYVENTS